MPPKRKAATALKKKPAAAPKRVGAKIRKTDKGKQLASDGTPLTFFVVPREIRDIIYRYAVGRPYNLIALNRTRIGSPRGCEPTISMTCRQVREEALGIFYAVNGFMFPLTALHFCPVVSWLEKLSLAHAKVIPRVIMTFEGPLEGWADVGSWLKIEERFLSASALVRFVSDTTLDDAWGSACGMGRELRKSGLEWDVVDKVMRGTFDIVGAALAYGNREWPMIDDHFNCECGECFDSGTSDYSDVSL